MNTEQRLGPGRNFGVIQEYEGLDQLAYVGGADKARDGSVPATAGDKRYRASASAQGWRILEFETTPLTGECCNLRVHFISTEA
jgi:hypothetical protein